MRQTSLKSPTSSYEGTRARLEQSHLLGRRARQQTTIVCVAAENRRNPPTRDMSPA